MLKIEKKHEHFVICSPLANFLLLKLILRPAQQSEFDMPALLEQQLGIQFRIKVIFYFLVARFDALPPLFVVWDYLQGTLKIALRNEE
jgi:hypothetical protein